MRIAKTNKGTKFVLFTIIIIIGILVFFKQSKISLDTNVLITFGINGFIWTILLFRELRNRAYSMAMMLWFFSIFFFSFAPTVQYAAGIFPWIFDRSDNILLRANILLMVWTISVLFGIKLVQYQMKRKYKKCRILYWKGYYKVLPILTIINIFNCINRIRAIGIGNMMARASNTGVVFSSYGSFSMMISGFFQAISYFSVVISIIRFKKNNLSIGYLIVNAICLLLSYFPTGMARYAAAVIYLGIFLTLFKQLKNNRIFILAFLAAFTIALPFLNAFRNYDFLGVNIQNTLSDIITNLTDTWKAFDYDAYTIFTLSIENVDMYGAGGGHILSILLFWVPRVIWPTKALSGSYEMAHDRNLAFDNLSCPLPAEGMLDGGVLGVILLGIAIGFIMERVDSNYWSMVDKEERYIRPLDILYPVIVIFWFFMCRGDMFYTFAFLVAYIITWWGIKLLVRLVNMIHI